MKKLVFTLLAIAVAGCAAGAKMPPPAQGIPELLAYAPPYTVAKLADACAQAKAKPTDALLDLECKKLTGVAQACKINIASIAAQVNTVLVVASSVEPVIAPVLAANQIVVPTLESIQATDCTVGGFLVQPSGAPAPSPSASATPSPVATPSAAPSPASK